MWVELSVGGAADLAKRNPEPPTGGEAYTDLLNDVKSAAKRRATDGAAFIFCFQIIYS
jgi:hypothetical protein